MPPERRGDDTERNVMPMSPGVVFDAQGNPVGYGDDFPGAPFGPPTGPPATGPNVPPAPNSAPTPQTPPTPRTPTAPAGTAVPRTPRARQGRGNVLSRILRNAASRLRGGNNNR